MADEFSSKRKGKYGKFQLDPEEAVGLHIESRLQTKHFVKKPNWDCPREGYELALIQNERELEATTKEKKEVLLETKEMIKNFKKQIGELEKTQENFKEKFEQSHDFSEECRLMEKELDHKILDELDKQRVLEEKLEAAHQKLTQQTVLRDHLREISEKFKVFEDFLQAVVDESAEYKSIDDLMAKTDATLLVAEEVLEMRGESLLEEKQLEGQLMKKRQENEQLTNELSKNLDDLENCNERAKTEGFKWEKVLVDVQNVVLDEALEYQTIVNSISHTYQLLCKRNGDEMNLKTLDEQLDYIKDEIELLRNVLAVVSKAKK